MIFWGLVQVHHLVEAGVGSGSKESSWASLRDGVKMDMEQERGCQFGGVISALGLYGPGSFLFCFFSIWFGMFGRLRAEFISVFYTISTA